MDYWVQNDALTGVPTTMKLTAKGAATRDRIVAAATDLMLARGGCGALCEVASFETLH